MTPKEIKEAFRNGKRVYSSLIVSPSPKWALSVKRTGIDFTFIDTEHIVIDSTTLSWMCRTYRQLDVPSVVIIPSPDPYQACKVLDAGACGVIAPYVETAEQVQGLVGATKFRPLKGKRLDEALADPGAMEPTLKQYIEKFCGDNILIINVESVPAMENMDELFSVPGLDGALIGPHDLSNSLGIPEDYNNPRFQQAVRTIITKAREYNLGVGIHFWMSIENEIEWVKDGANLIMHSSDIDIYEQNLKRDIRKIKTELGDPVDDRYDGIGDII